MRLPDYTVKNIGVDIDVDEEGLNRTMMLYINALGVSIEAFFRRQGRLLCQDMLDYTLPYDPDPPESGSRAGRNANARKRGIESMEFDIDRIFKPLANAGWADIAEVDNYGIFNAWLLARKEAGASVPPAFDHGMGSEKDWQTFQGRWKGKEGFFHEDQKPDYSTVYGGSTIEAAHIATRGGNRVPDYKTGMSSTYKVFLVAYPSQIQAYKKKVAMRVGSLKAGWYSAGVAIGDGVKLSAPYWITGNQWGTGIMVDQLSSRPVLSLTVGNSAHYNMSKPRGVNEWNNAVSHRAYSIREELARRLSNRRAETVEAATAALLETGLFTVEEWTPF